MMGVMIHVIGDAINNLGIIVASLFMGFMTSESRYYADPAVSVGISLMIFMTALPLVKTSGAILLQGAPEGVNIADVRHDLEMVRFLFFFFFFLFFWLLQNYEDVLV